MPWLRLWGQGHGHRAVAGLASWAMLVLLLAAVGAAELRARRKLCTGHSHSR
jgi:deoxyinosine 3'endonuclease (endonuclease V)